MAFDWYECHRLARILSGLDNRTDFKNSEAAIRASIGRAYYGAFCHARDYAENNHGVKFPERGRAHSEVLSHYKGKNNMVATKLEELRLWRNKCDYEAKVNNLTSMASNAIGYSGRVFSELK